MKRLLSLFVISAVFIPAAGQAMPVASLAHVSTGLTIEVGSGCGLGVRRGPLDGCDPAYIYGGYDSDYDRGFRHGYHHGYRRGYYDGYHDAYYPYVRYHGVGDVVVVGQPVCAFGSYLRCSHGTCWQICY